jgi:mRNA-degrading endonuclease toxin of MazEF toxin-antitoxin module
VLVISADPYNRSTLQTVTVVVLSTTRRLAMLPGNVTIPAAPGLLSEDSVVNVTQIATVDPLALEEHIGQLPDGLVAQVNAWSPASAGAAAKLTSTSSPTGGHQRRPRAPFDRDESSPRSLLARGGALPHPRAIG